MTMLVHDRTGVRVPDPNPEPESGTWKFPRPVGDRDVWGPMLFRTVMDAAEWVRTDGTAPVELHEVISGKCGRTVDFWVVRRPLKDLGTQVTQWVLTTGESFRMSGWSCLSDDCISGVREPCVCRKAAGSTPVTDWLKHLRHYCHGWHELRVQYLAQQILASYAPVGRPVPGGCRNGNDTRILPYAPCPTWPVRNRVERSGTTPLPLFRDGRNRHLGWTDGPALPPKESSE
jgi:hypothetical protein